MGIISFDEEISSKVAPARLFKGLITDNHNLFPKISPLLVKSAAIIQGDGGAGSIKQLNFADGAPFSYVKLKIDELDEAQFICKYTFIEGGELNETIKSIYSETKCEPTADGGCLVKLKRVFTITDGVELNREELKSQKIKAQKLFAGVEGYLLKNPIVYA